MEAIIQESFKAKKEQIEGIMMTSFEKGVINEQGLEISNNGRGNFTVKTGDYEGLERFIALVDKAKTGKKVKPFFAAKTVDEPIEVDEIAEEVAEEEENEPIVDVTEDGIDLQLPSKDRKKNPVGRITAASDGRSLDDDFADDLNEEYHEQSDYKGEMEAVPADLYTEKLECECGEIRWLKPSDVFQVTHCKPCTWRIRTERKKEKARIKREEKKAAALEIEDSKPSSMPGKTVGKVKAELQEMVDEAMAEIEEKPKRRRKAV